MKNYLFLFIAICLFSSCRQEINFISEEPVFKQGDDLSWSKKDFDDSNWAKDRGNTGNNIFWVRAKVNLAERPSNLLGLKLDAFGAFDVYWDGVFIGKNGNVVGSTAEVAGTATSYYSIPDKLATQGNHVIALRASQSYYQQTQRSVGVYLNTYKSLIKAPLVATSFMHLMAGAFLIAAIYYLFLFINSRKRQYTVLIFAVICLLFFALLILEYIKFYVEIPYTHFFLRLESIGWLTFTLSILVP